MYTFKFMSIFDYPFTSSIIVLLCHHHLILSYVVPLFNIVSVSQYSPILYYYPHMYTFKFISTIDYPFTSSIIVILCNHHSITSYYIPSSNSVILSPYSNIFLPHSYILSSTNDIIPTVLGDHISYNDCSYSPG